MVNVYAFMESLNLQESVECMGYAIVYKMVKVRDIIFREVKNLSSRTQFSNCHYKNMN